MAYVLTKEPTFKIEVTVREPGTADDGAFEKHAFVAEFKRLDADQIEALMKSNRPIKDALADLLVGWNGLTDAGGCQLQFNVDLRDALLKIPHALVGLWDAFLDGSSGAARKN